MTQTTEFRTLNGRRFHLYRWGDPANPPLLLLHGFPEYGGAWADLAPLLENHFHCIAPDQRGFGQSWSPEGVENYAASELIGDMVALIRQLDAPVTVFGHDWGAAIAYGLAMFHPDLITRLIIANGVHPVPFQHALAQGGAQSAASQYIDFLRQPGSEEMLAADGFAKLRALFSANMDLSWLSGARLIAYQQAWKDAAQLHCMLNWYRASPLRVARPGEPLTDLPEFPVDRLQVRCPHLLLWGAGDTALLPETTKGLETFAPDLTRVTVPEADHWLLHQQPRKVANAVLAWTAS